MKGHIKSILILRAFTKYKDHIFEDSLISEYLRKYKNKMTNL